MDRIFLTGGTGSLGQALMDAWPEARFTVFSRDEWKQSEMKPRYPKNQFVLGSVCDKEALALAMRGHRYVIHAAAYKQIPSAEANSFAAIETNVLGSRNVMMAAAEVGVSTVVGISTDKACTPINCYGQTKALMEKMFQEASRWPTHTKYTLCRYGNVLGSRGSIVPLFEKQIRESKPLTITSEAMTRFWLTLSDAVTLVKRATEAPNGVIVVPKAPASSIMTLATAVGMRAGVKIETRIIGARPGEKFHEDLVGSYESTSTVVNSDGFWIFPAGTNCGSSEITYSSDKARQLTPEQMVAALDGKALL